MGNSARETCNEQRGRTIVKNLERRHFDAWYCATKEEACSLALKLIPEGASVSWGGSMTIRDIGLTEALKKGNYRVIDRDEARTEEEKKKAYLDAFDADYYLASVNALSEDGVLVNIDGNGNRVAAMVYGPRNVLLVAGLNKAAKTAAEAVSRARNVAAPMNQHRFDHKTPCMTTGTCENCLSPDCICSQILITRNASPKGRIKVILVGEELGF